MTVRQPLTITNESDKGSTHPCTRLFLNESLGRLDFGLYLCNHIQQAHVAMKLILFTKPTYSIEESRIINALFEEGLDILHLDKPHTPPVYAERLLTLIPDKYHKRIVVHDHFYLKEEYKLRGIHLSEQNPFIPERYAGQISATSDNFDEVVADKVNCDYVFLDRVFDGISYPGNTAKYTDEELRQASKKGIIDKRVIALGGVSIDNILQIKDFGFGGAAVRGALWNQFDPYTDTNFVPLIRYFCELKKLAD